VDAVTIDNYARYVITSNEDHVVNAELTDRRHTVLEVSDAHLQDRPYFAAIEAELGGGGRARLLWELLRTDIGDGYVAPYENAARASQQLTGLEPVAAWFCGLLVEGTLLWADTGNPIQVATPVMFDAFQKSAREDSRYVKYNSFGMRLGRVTSTRPTQFRPVGEARRVRGYLMPPLADARSEFVRKTGLNVNWENGAATGSLPSWLRAR
jgi:Mesyanzhinovviridae DNA primase